jgi:hypothetical protein
MLGSSKERFLRSVDPPQPEADDSLLPTLMALAELLNSDKATKARIKALSDATEKAIAMVAAAANDTAAATKLVDATKAQLASERADHDRRLAAQVKEYEAKMKAG